MLRRPCYRSFGYDPQGDTVLEQTTTAGVNCEYVRRVPERTGNYMALQNSADEMQVAISWIWHNEFA